MKTGKSVTIGVVATALGYNKRYSRQRLARADLLERPQGCAVPRASSVIPPLNNSYGLQTVVMMARLNGGGEKNIDPGFKVMKNEISPERAGLRTAPGKMTECSRAARRYGGVGQRSRARRSRTRAFPSSSSIRKKAHALGIAACPVASPTPRRWRRNSWVHALARTGSDPRQGRRRRPREPGPSASKPECRGLPYGPRGQTDQSIGTRSTQPHRVEQPLDARGRALTRTAATALSAVALVTWSSDR